MVKVKSTMDHNRQRSLKSIAKGKQKSHAFHLPIILTSIRPFRFRSYKKAGFDVPLSD